MKGRQQIKKTILKGNSIGKARGVYLSRPAGLTAVPDLEHAVRAHRRKGQGPAGGPDGAVDHGSMLGKRGHGLRTRGVPDLHMETEQKK